MRTFYQIFLGHKHGDDWWGHAARTKEVRNVHKISVRKPDWRRLRYNNFMDPKDIGCERGLK
jgi:hypothetical protein